MSTEIKLANLVRSFGHSKAQRLSAALTLHLSTLTDDLLHLYSLHFLKQTPALITSILFVVQHVGKDEK